MRFGKTPLPLGTGLTMKTSDILERLDASERRLFMHVAGCPSCREALLAELARYDSASPLLRKRTPFLLNRIESEELGDACELVNAMRLRGVSGWQIGISTAQRVYTSGGPQASQRATLVNASRDKIARVFHRDPRF